MRKHPQTYPNKKTIHTCSKIIPKYTLKDICSDTIFNDNAIKNFTNNNKICISSENINDINHVQYLVINNVIPQTIPFNITHVLIYFYDKPILTLPDSITHLVVSDYYNLQITLPNKLQYLKIGYSYNQKLLLPDSLNTFIINGCYDQDLELPCNLQKLVLRGFFNKQVILPNSVKYVHVGMFYQHHFHNEIKKFIKD